ncbi:hypothetical protein [Salinisphaera sp. G21_0]|uniref:hypothetical protein n=1 Tax=Salinisphaera sp. G21_0 TaxID=2821094 RepID=UPI001ADC3C22|nr:hypothetical protein [Salinisphaera sp. G21_0]MBO9483781.1 hypothetical protein [Salinisphaera sp. G21_0]
MKRDRSALLKEVLKLNGLSHKDLCSITNKTENTVFKWLNSSLVVPDIAIAQVKTALSKARMSIPRELIREYNSVLYSAVKWGGNNRTENSQATLVGEKKQDRTESPFYIFRGERMQRAQIVRLSQLAYRTVYDRLSGIEPETDVTELINRERWER